MKLHSDTLNRISIREALLAAQKSGKVDPLVDFSTLDARGSRTRSAAFEVRLEWLGTKVKGDGRKWTNSGNQGSGGTYAASYDEWGWFITELYRIDPDMVFGHYKNLEGFHEMTRYRFV
jgi:hypothetical protein